MQLRKQKKQISLKIKYNLLLKFEKEHSCKDRVSGLYIIPICPECNNPENNTIFHVDERELVKVS